MPEPQPCVVSVALKHANIPVGNAAWCERKHPISTDAYEKPTDNDEILMHQLSVLSRMARGYAGRVGLKPSEHCEITMQFNGIAGFRMRSRRYNTDITVYMTVRSRKTPKWIYNGHRSYWSTLEHGRLNPNILFHFDKKDCNYEVDF